MQEWVVVAQFNGAFTFLVRFLVQRESADLGFRRVVDVVEADFTALLGGLGFEIRETSRSFELAREL